MDIDLADCLRKMKVYYVAGDRGGGGVDFLRMSAHYKTEKMPATIFLVHPEGIQSILPYYTTLFDCKQFA